MPVMIASGAVPGRDELEPGVCRQEVADALAQARRTCGLTQQQAARKLDWSASKLIRIETGASRVQITDLGAALSLYQAGPAETERLTGLARAARRPPWYWLHRGVTPDLGRYLAAERSATAITGYRAREVPGLLQTPGYTAGLLLAAGAGRAGERVALLEARQHLLRSPRCPDICYLLDEAVLRRQAGGPDVMTAQLDALSQAAAHPRVTVRVVPFTTGTVLAADLTVLTVPGLIRTTWHRTSDGGYAQDTPAAAGRHHEQIARLLDLSVPLEHA